MKKLSAASIAKASIRLEQLAKNRDVGKRTQWEPQPQKDTDELAGNIDRKKPMIETQQQRDKRTKAEKEIRAKRAKRYENDMKRWAKKIELAPDPNEIKLEI